MLRKLTPEELPVTVPVILMRAGEAGVFEKIDLQHILFQVENTMKEGSGVVFADDALEPTRALWIIYFNSPFFNKRVSHVMFISIADESQRNMRSFLELYNAAKAWSKENNCVEMTVASWMGAGNDISALLEHCGGVLQEKQYRVTL